MFLAPPRPRALLVIMAFVSEALLAGASPALAANCVWNGKGNSPNWSDGGNWIGCFADGPHNDDKVFFLPSPDRHTSFNNKGTLQAPLRLSSISFVGEPFAP